MTYISEQTTRWLDNFYTVNVMDGGESRNDAVVMDQDLAEGIISILRVNDWLNLYEYGCVGAA